MPDSRFRRALTWLTDRPHMIRLTLFDWLHPPPETPIDRAIREEGERLRRAFPTVNWDDPAPRKSRP